MVVKVSKFQFHISKKKNIITLFSGLLIAMAYVSLFIFKNTTLFTWSLIIASIIGVIPIAIQAIQSLKVKVVSIDVLVSIAVIAAFLIQEYQESAIVTFLFLFGSYLEAKTLNYTRKAIRSLLDLAPSTALRINDDQTLEEVNIDEIEIGNHCLVRTGSSIPVDGQVLSGEGVVNEASITGESIPLSKQFNDWVYAGTILENGTITIEAQRVGDETTFGKIIELVEEAQDSKTTTQRFIDRFSRVYTPFVLVLAILVWLFTQDIETAIIILVLGCPGALVIGVPVSAVAGIGNGAKYGVLFKGSEVIQSLSKVNTIVFDKTGTLTLGHPQVIESYYYIDEHHDLKSMIMSIERESNHPLAQAIVTYLDNSLLTSVLNTHVFQGEGLQATTSKGTLLIGNQSLMKRFEVMISTHQNQHIEALLTQGASIVLVAKDQQLLALFGIEDPVRQSAYEDLKKLKLLGVKELILLSGDHELSVKHVAAQLELTQAHAHLLPQDKAMLIKQYQNEGKTVAFVGDGINDSPSIALADIGIAMGSGTDVAIETSDVVLMKSDFKHLVHAIGLSKAMMNNMRQNIIIAIGVVVFLIANVFLSEWMNMSIGMLVHELSILIVIVNGMRLLQYKKGEKQ
ncbi:MAG: heavy metal translocating P-type ATPase [Erysipelothrix sp.]|nr:heavy metal translocating P-type ATPase [Erysipelothrix sp.]